LVGSGRWLNKKKQDEGWRECDIPSYRKPPELAKWEVLTHFSCTQTAGAGRQEWEDETRISARDYCYII
jgi:hypothetical protein